MTDKPLPAPLVPAEVDLRSFDWFPFYHKRLRQSSFWKRASDLACRISVDFWAEAYEQVPAASLPDDDHVLAEWAGFGRRDLQGWLAVKDEVMSAWVRCSDGRFYHPTLGEVACKAWAERRLHLWERECERLRKANYRRAKEGLEPLPLPPKPSIDPEEKTEPYEDKPQKSDGRPADVQGLPAENALKGTGTGTGTEEKIGGVMRACARKDPPTAKSGDLKPPRRRGRQAAQETLWPDELAFGEADRSYAAKHGFAGQVGERLFEKFEAKAKAKGWAYRDWHAAFRTFVLNEHPPPLRPNGSAAWRPPDV